MPRDGHLPTNRISRLVPLAGLAGRSVLGAADSVIRRRRSSSDLSPAEIDRVERLATRYASVLGEMKGAAMKACQILSFVDAEGLIPDAYKDLFQGALSSLQDDVPPMSPGDARAVFEQELGVAPEKVFTFFSPNPIAAASIGQVHAAHLPDGTELAVKIQYPGAAEAVNADLANTDLLVDFVKIGLSLMGGKAPSVNPKEIVEEVRDRIVEELDYRSELTNQSLFADAYRGHPFIRIPGVREDLSTQRVLTMEFVDGRRWAAALASEEELKMAWGETVFRFVFMSLYREGLFNADPHPGNYLFHEDGTVTFLDFGCVKRFSPSQLALLSALDQAALDNDSAALVRSFEDIGMLTPDDSARIDPERLLDFYRLQLKAVWSEQPFRFTPEYAAQLVASTYDPFGEWGDVGLRISMPKDLVFLNRLVIGLMSILGRLGATANWRAIDAEVRLGGPPASRLGELDERWYGQRESLD